MDITVKRWKTLQDIDHHGCTLHEIIDEILSQNLNVMVIKNDNGIVVWIDKDSFQQS